MVVRHLDPSGHIKEPSEYDSGADDVVPAKDRRV